MWTGWTVMRKNDQQRNCTLPLWIRENYSTLFRVSFTFNGFSFQLQKGEAIFFFTPNSYFTSNTPTRVIELQPLVHRTFQKRLEDQNMGVKMEIQLNCDHSQKGFVLLVDFTRLCHNKVISGTTVALCTGYSCRSTGSLKGSESSHWKSRSSSSLQRPLHAWGS